MGTLALAKLPELWQRPRYLARKFLLAKGAPRAELERAGHETQRSNRSLREIQEIANIEVAHRLADDILCRLLSSLGYASCGYNKVGKWYASQ
jgi:hypothetical protein